jgi:hypothetical protein
MGDRSVTMGTPAALVFALATLLSQPQPSREPPPATAPPATDVTCSLASINVISKVVPGSGKLPRCSASASLSIKIPEGARAAARNVVITEVLDEKGQDILVKRDRGEVRAEDERRDLCDALRNSFTYKQEGPTGFTNAELAAVPAKISSLSGELDAFVARNVVRENIELKPMEEPIELVPGLKFLLTSVEPRENTTRISFEVHIRRRRDKADGEMGLEPVFGGLTAVRKDGLPGPTYDYGSDFDTRDEHIMILKAMDVYTQDIAGWQVCAMDRIEKVHLTFRTKGLKIAEEGR